MDSKLIRQESKHDLSASVGRILGEESRQSANIIELLMLQWQPKRTKEEERLSLVSQYFEQMASLFPGKFDADYRSDVEESAKKKSWKMTGGEAAVKRAAFELWPNGRPPEGLRAKVRDAKIRKKLADSGLHAASPATIRRALHKMLSGLSAPERN
jgi:hypothetical protein